MSPLAPLGRDRAIERVEAGQIPCSFGSPHPCVAIVEEDGVFRIRALVIDEEEARRQGEAALAAKRAWMPEHYYALGRPTGAIHAEAPTRELLVVKMKAMCWPSHW